MKYLQHHEALALREACEEFDIEIPESAISADRAVEEAINYSERLRQEQEPEEMEAKIDFRLRQPKRIELAHDILNEREYSRRLEYTNISAGLFPAFADRFAAEVQIFSEACDALAEFRVQEAMGSAMTFDVDGIINAEMGDTLTAARKAADRMQKLIHIRGYLLCFSVDEPKWSGLLRWPLFAVGARFRTLARFSVPTGSNVDTYNAIRLAPGVSELRLLSPDEIEQECAKARGEEDATRAATRAKVK